MANRASRSSAGLPEQQRVSPVGISNAPIFTLGHTVVKRVLMLHWRTQAMLLYWHKHTPGVGLRADVGWGDHHYRFDTYNSSVANLVTGEEFDLSSYFVRHTPHQPSKLATAAQVWTERNTCPQCGPHTLSCAGSSPYSKRTMCWVCGKVASVKRVDGNEHTFAYRLPAALQDNVQSLRF